jgi:hypothetical protein
MRRCAARAGIDPGICKTLRQVDEAKAELAALPDTPALRRADKRLLARTRTADDDAEAAKLDAKMTDLLGRFRNGYVIEDEEFAGESLVMLFAWALTREEQSPRPAAGEG